MKFCTDHWTRLRQAIADRGMDGLVPRSGVEAVTALKDELTQGRKPSNFEPLMAAHWAIAGNANDAIARAGGNPLYLMSGGPEDPVTGYPGYEGRTWPRCPLCYINLVHEVSCKGGACRLPQIGGYDWMIERAADDALVTWRELNAAGGGAR